MKIIALETSGRYGSIAALDGESGQARLIRQTALGGDQRTAQTLAPELQRLLVEIGWSPKSVELVAVAVGPGSFTGLRIGVTTAKVFAYGVAAGTIAVNTLDAMAVQAPAGNKKLWTILDAQRKELFVGQFPDPAADHSGECRVSIVSEDAWLTGLQPGERVMGPPLRKLVGRLPEGVDVVPEEFWQPMAAAVGVVAWRAYQAGRRDDLFQLVPQYHRPSYAEEKVARKE